MTGTATNRDTLLSHPSRPRTTAPFAVIVAAGLAWSPVSASDARFAEPTTGRPVTEYRVTLPLIDGEERTVDVPADCAEVEQLVAAHRNDTARVIGRRLWRKVREDCWFHEFLRRHPDSGLKDYVSDYDFMNARLEDLPIDRGCIAADGSRAATPCDPTTTDAHGMLRGLPLPGSPDAIARVQADECRLHDGLFYGRLVAGTDGVSCVVDDGRASVRLIAVDYADANGDGYLDAVLRFVPIGPGVARAPLILPLTRKEPTGPFSVIERGRRR